MGGSEKREIAAELPAWSAVIVNGPEQRRDLGDLQYAPAPIVRAAPAEMVGSRVGGRLSDEEVMIFDSTGTGLQAVAAAVPVYERSLVSDRAGLVVAPVESMT